MSFLNDDDNIGRLTCLNVSESPSEKATPPLCRFHFLQGNCRYGEKKCAYSHKLPRGVSMMEVRQHIPCPYYLRGGNCRYGDFCELRHDPGDLPGAKGKKYFSSDATANNSQLKTKTKDASAEVCGICLEDVTEAGHKFGLLSCCLHTFCFQCLMEWRKEGTDEALDRRCCPTCRKKSNYVIPSSTMPASLEEKEHIVEEYRTKLSRIPCKRYPNCHFGKDCFYAHLDAKGNNCKHKDKTMQELYEMRRKSRSRRSSTNDLQSDIDFIAQMLLLDMYAFRDSLGFDDDSCDDSDVEDVWDYY